MFAIKGWACFIVLLCLFTGLVCRLVTAPRDAWVDLRRFVKFRDIEVGMQSPATALMILGGGLLLFGLLLWIVGWAVGNEIILTIGTVQFWLVLPVLVGYLNAFLACSIVREAFRPLRPKHRTPADGVKAYGSWKFTKRRRYSTPGFVKPPEETSVLPTSRFGNQRGRAT